MQPSTSSFQPPPRWTPPEVLFGLGDAAISELVDVFLANTGRYLAHMEELLARADFAGVKTQAHKIKGGACQMGASSMTGLCLQIEDSALTASPSDLRRLIDQLRSAFTDVGIDMAAFSGVEQ